MTLILALSALLLAFSAFCVFGLPYLLAGPRLFDEFFRNHEQQVLGALLIAAMIVLTTSPFMTSALISNDVHVQVGAGTYSGLNGI